MTEIQIDQLDSPIGPLHVAVHDGALVSLRFDDRGSSGADVVARFFPDAEVRPTEDPGGTLSALRRYFDGDIRAIDALSVDCRGTAFQESVWKALREVPAGGTATYGEIGARIGAPRAVRAVGSATGRNPVGIVVPCHRILPAAGGVGNYGGGVHRKEWLLAHEQAHT